MRRPPAAFRFLAFLGRNLHDAPLRAVCAALAFLLTLASASGGLAILRRLRRAGALPPGIGAAAYFWRFSRELAESLVSVCRLSADPGAACPFPVDLDA